MKNIKKLVQDIHKGKDLTVNLEVYRDMAVGAYHDYAAIELVFSAYLLMEELGEIRPEYEQKEEKIIRKIREAVRTVIDGDADGETAMDSVRQMREEITGKMDLSHAIPCLLTGSRRTCRICGSFLNRRKIRLKDLKKWFVSAKKKESS